MDVDMRVFLTESIGYSYPLNESSKSDDRKFSDKLNDILTPIIKKMRELFERFRSKFGSIISKILSKLGLNPAKDLKTFKEAVYAYSRLPEEKMARVERLDYSYELVDNFRIIDKVVTMYKRVMDDIKIQYKCDSQGIRYIRGTWSILTLYDANESSWSFTLKNIDNWGELMGKALAPKHKECYAICLRSGSRETIYSIETFDEILRRGKSEYINSINNKASSLKNNINDIINDGKNELKSSIKNNREQERLAENTALERISKLASTIPPVMLAVTNGIMGAAAESCRRAVVLANIVNAFNRENGYGDVVNVPDEEEVAVAKSSASFSNLMR